MSRLQPDTEWLRLGSFTLSTRRRELRHLDQRVEIGERALDLLLVLALNLGRSVTKAQLLQTAWRGRVVELSNLTVQIAAIRRVFAQGKDGPAVRTIPGLGYMLVEPLATGTPIPPEPAPGAAPPHREPGEPLTLFIGRDHERRAVMDLLCIHRLVSVVGIGGVGKTRLALRLRRDLAPAFPDGVSVVDLAAIVDPAQVAEAAAAAVDVGNGGTSAEDALVSALHAKTRLLIFDNAEHLTSAVRALLKLLLASCPGLSALVTSRESLGLPGEAVFRLCPLALPPETAELTAAAALATDAVRLFADRAAALLPGFVVDDANAPQVAAICHRLDGIALAIEMAVPRLEILTAGQLADRLHDRFRTLAGSRDDVAPRQRTLRAMFDWSWELLSPRERVALQHLAIFPAGTTIGTLEAMSTPGGVDGLESLTALAQKSLATLVPPTSPGLEPRFRLLETTRQYALDQLEPGQRAALGRQFALALAERFEAADAEWASTHSATWLGRYGPDADNLRAAMQWAFDTAGESALALRLVAASMSLWWELPSLPLRESRHWFTLALLRITPDTPPAVEARLWLGQSWTDTLDGDVENFPAADRAARLFRRAGDPVGEGAALWRAASTVMLRDHTPSEATLLDAAITALEGQGAIKWRALCHVRRADLLQHAGELLPALAEYDEALTLMRATGHAYGRMVCVGNRSYLLFKLGRADEAIASLEALRHELPQGLGRPLVSLLAMILTAAGHDDDARATILDSLTGTLTIGMVATLARSLEALALLLAQSGQHAFATCLLGYVLTLHPLGRPRLGPRQVVYDRLDALLAERFAAEERARLIDEGAQWSDSEATEAAVRFCNEMGLSPHPLSLPEDLSWPSNSPP